MSRPPCATKAKFSAALPTERKECAIFPFSMPLSGSPARRRKLSDFAVIVGALRSEPHSTARCNVTCEHVVIVSKKRQRTDQRLRKRRKGLRAVQWQLLRRTTVADQVRALAFNTVIEMVEEGVVDDAEHGALLVNESDRDAGEREPVYEVRSSVYYRADEILTSSTAWPNTPIGSTQNVGASVRGGRVPEE